MSAVPPAGPDHPETPKQLLRRLGIHPKKQLGQHFMIDPRALERVVQAAEVTPADEVLEIGAGIGTLTERLLEHAGRVVAVELDPQLVGILQERLEGHPKLEVAAGDILRFPPADWFAEPYKVVGNIPYYITSAILRHLLEAQPRPTTLVLTMQKEVTARILSREGWSLLAVSVHFYGRPRLMGHISRHAFYPVPNVDSAILRVDVFPQPAVSVPNTRWFFRVVKAGFSAPRKQLRNTLAHGLGIPAEDVEEALNTAGVDPRRRAETLSLEEWGAVCWALAPHSAGLPAGEEPAGEAS
ncbi:MAG: 16S rRNA (adenine(1518)-N(6)/adenine(1519)-N(6))-dimethyltransferase RsmA [Anaerolineae bacterium]